MSVDWTRPSREGRQWDLIRFFVSPHSRDLLCIASIAFGSCVAFLVLLPILTHDEKSSDNVALLVAVISATLGVCAWAFQAANLRFGAADIFASEIGTLCRVCAVTDFIPNHVKRVKGEGHLQGNSAQSTQDYLVIYNSNSKDLEALDGQVVSQVTEFYVYFKAMLDALSRSPQSQSLDMLYMAFLAFESGREALIRLMDDRTAREEAVLIVLLSEIPAYRYLLEEFGRRSEDLRCQRLRVRMAGYNTLIEQVAKVADSREAGSATHRQINQFAKEVMKRWKTARQDNVPAPASEAA